MNFNFAIVRGISTSLIRDAQRIEGDHSPIDEEKMHQECTTYKKVMKDLGIQIIEIPASHDLPDCVFTEDAAVIVGNKAVATRLGHPNRKGEHVEMVKAIKETNLELFDMNECDDLDATVDGGDVLYTGDELFVGISKRSTPKGAHYLAKVFQIPVHHITVEDNLHLKSNVTLLKPGTIVYSDDKAGQGVMKQIQEKSTKSYDFVAVPDEKASNVVYISHEGKRSLLVPSGWPDSLKIIREQVEKDGINIIELENSQLSKVDGCLTCKSVLF